MFKDFIILKHRLSCASLRKWVKITFLRLFIAISFFSCVNLSQAQDQKPQDYSQELDAEVPSKESGAFEADSYVRYVPSISAEAMPV